MTFPTLASSIYQLLNQQKDRSFFSVTFSIPDFSPPGHGYADLKANVFSFENRSSALKIQKRIDPNTYFQAIWMKACFNFRDFH